MFPNGGNVLTRAIVRSPSRNFAEGLTSSALGPPDYELATQQHDAYCATLQQLGISLTRLPADERYPDSTFVEDAAVIAERVAVITRPGAPSRQGEVEDISEALHHFYSTLQKIEEPGTLDGGDICQVDDDFFIGISERTNEDGAAQLSRILERAGYTSTFIDVRNFSSTLLHLKSGLAYLGQNRLVVDAELRDRYAFKKFQVISPDPSEAYAANCLAFGSTVLIAANHPRFELQLRQHGFNTIAVDMSEFQKMDGGLSCLSLRF